MKALCFSHSLDSEAPMAYIRLNAPYEQAGIQILNALDTSLQIKNVFHEIDFVLFQRELPINSFDFFEIVSLARKNKKPIVFEIDDLLFFLPETHPDYGRNNHALSLLPTFQVLMEADIVTVSSPMLKQILGSFNSNIHLLHNFYDDTLWTFNSPTKKYYGQDVLTIGFMGSSSHQPDLNFILPVLLNLIERYQGKIKFHFWGAKPPHELLKNSQVQWSSQQFSTYIEFVKYFQTQSADIFIAPLEDNLFNRGKSFIKFFEYSAIGAPGVYSRLDPYEEVIADRQNGLLASSLSEWRDCLIELIENDNLRYQLALNAQDAIKNKWLLSRNSYRWHDIFHQLIANHDYKKSETPLQRLLKNINNQQELAISNLKKQYEKIIHSPTHLFKSLFLGVLFKIRLYPLPFLKSPKKAPGSE